MDQRCCGGSKVQIGVSQTATFADATTEVAGGQPEQRDYQVLGLLHGAPVGGVSGTVSGVRVP